ncbi:MAG: hypothetical protein IPL73_13100 [Candidatus Obscuribacter sp.]|nr:hypothetical protein [Candidatus Obscuribacter sp.]
MSFSVTPALLNLWGYGFVLATGLFFTVWLVVSAPKTVALSMSSGGLVLPWWRSLFWCGCLCLAKSSQYQ